MTKSPHGRLARLSWTRKYKRLDAFFTVSLMCSFHDKSLVIITPSSFALLTASSWLPFTRIVWNSDYFLVKEILSSLHFSLFSWTLLSIACSRLRDGGGKSFSNKKCETRATPPPPFPSRVRLIFALLVLIRSNYTIWEPGTGYII